MSPRGISGNRGGGYPRLAGKTSGDISKGKALFGALTGAVVLVSVITYFLLPHVRPGPKNLYTSVLSGPRTVQGPVCLDLAIDVSGSMRNRVKTRDAAVGQLQDFLRAQKQTDDVLASVVFSDKAAITVKPIQARLLPQGALARTVDLRTLGNRYTYLGPAVQQLGKAYERSAFRCSAHALVVVTDDELSDEPADLLKGFERLHFKHVYFALPDRDDDDRPWLTKSLPEVITRGFRDADGLSLLYGRALADLTGQKLEQVPEGAVNTTAAMPS